MSRYRLHLEFISPDNEDPWRKSKSWVSKSFVLVGQAGPRKSERSDDDDLFWELEDEKVCQDVQVKAALELDEQVPSGAPFDGGELELAVEGAPQGRFATLAWEAANNILTEKGCRTEFSLAKKDSSEPFRDVNADVAWVSLFWRRGEEKVRQARYFFLLSRVDENIRQDVNAMENDLWEALPIPSCLAASQDDRMALLKGFLASFQGYGGRSADEDVVGIRLIMLELVSQCMLEPLRMMIENPRYIQIERRGYDRADNLRNFGRLESRQFAQLGDQSARKFETVQSEHTANTVEVQRARELLFGFQKEVDRLEKLVEGTREEPDTKPRFVKRYDIDRFLRLKNFASIHLRKFAELCEGALPEEGSRDLDPTSPVNDIMMWGKRYRESCYGLPSGEACEGLRIQLEHEKGGG